MKKVLKIEIDGEEYTAESSLGAMLLFKKETDREVTEISGLSDSIVWLWCCVKSASAKTDRPLTLDCQEFADRCTMEVLQEWSRIQQSEKESETKKKTQPKNRRASTSS